MQFTSLSLNYVVQMNHMQDTLQILILVAFLMHVFHGIGIDDLITQCSNGHVGSAKQFRETSHLELTLRECILLRIYEQSTVLKYHVAKTGFICRYTVGECFSKLILGTVYCLHNS